MLDPENIDLEAPTRWEDLRRELRPTLSLAVPLVVADLGWRTMDIVDTIMVGHQPQSAEAIGGVSLATVLFAAVGVFGNGLLLGLDPIVSQAYGAGRVDRCHRSLFDAVYLCLVIAPLLMGVMWLLGELLEPFGIHPAVRREAVPYLHAITWSMLPLMLYFSARRYLQGMSIVKPVAIALLTANGVNLLGNWALIYGHLGFPAMGTVGSGWSTTLSRVYMAAVLFGYVAWRDHRHGTGLRRTEILPDFVQIRELVRFGLPAATQLVVEIAAIALAAALIGRLQPEWLAAHQIALATVSLTFMVPLGISSAAAVRVGQALGRGKLRAASHAGWTAIALGAGIMGLAALVLIFAPRYIVLVFSHDAAVMRAGVALLLVSAFFQLFDGLQIVATGALRGAGDTRTPMLCHLVAYWLVGLPLGAALCFRAGQGAVGIWVGLCVALILIGIVLLLAWRRQVRRFHLAPARLE